MRDMSDITLVGASIMCQQLNIFYKYANLSAHSFYSPDLHQKYPMNTHYKKAQKPNKQRKTDRTYRGNDAVPSSSGMVESFSQTTLRITEEYEEDKHGKKIDGAEILNTHTTTICRKIDGKQTTEQ